MSTKILLKEHVLKVTNYSSGPLDTSEFNEIAYYINFNGSTSTSGSWALNRIDDFGVRYQLQGANLPNGSSSGAGTPSGAGDTSRSVGNLIEIAITGADGTADATVYVEGKSYT